MSKQALYDRGVGRDYATVTIGEKTKDGKIVIHEMLKGRDAERWIEENVGDSDPPAPVSPTAYHNVFPPVTPEGIQEAIAKLRTNRLDHEYADDCQCEDCQWARVF